MAHIYRCRTHRRIMAVQSSAATANGLNFHRNHRRRLSAIVPDRHGVEKCGKPGRWHGWQVKSAQPKTIGHRASRQATINPTESNNLWIMPGKRRCRLAAPCAVPACRCGWAWDRRHLRARRRRRSFDRRVPFAARLWAGHRLGRGRCPCSPPRALRARAPHRAARAPRLFARRAAHLLMLAMCCSMLRAMLLRALPVRWLMIS